MSNGSDGWTKTPNKILEAMPHMGEAELKLTAILVRETYGRQRDSVKMTYDDMEAAAKLSRGGVSNAIEAVKARGFFIRGNKSMWATNSLPNRLKSIDDSLPSRLNPTEETILEEEIVYPVDQDSLPSRLNHTSPKNKEKKEENIYIPPAPQPVVDMIAALSQVNKTPYGAGFNEKEYEDAAYLLIGKNITPAQVASFAPWWEKNGFHPGKPVLRIVLQEIDNALAGLVADKRPKNGNGKHPPERPAIIDPTMPKPGQGGVW